MQTHLKSSETNMFTKLAILFVIFQLSAGNPLETIQGAQREQTAEKAQIIRRIQTAQIAENPNPAYDVQSFLSSRIVGGIDAPKGFAPHMVALISGYWIRSLVCGGSIITKRHVLTAAHCIDPFVHRGELSKSFTGVVGTNYWNSTYTEIKFCAFRNHPHWDWANIKNDIGLLVTTKDITFTILVQPIDLNYAWMDGGQLCYVTGWGRLGAWKDIPYILQLLFVTTLTPKDCEERVSEHNWGLEPLVNPAIEICTFHSKGHGMCNGDSGSALVHYKKQIGIVSWGWPCATGAPDVFVRISGFKFFIIETIHKYNTCKRDC